MLLWLLGALAALYLLAAIALTLLQRQLIYAPNRQRPDRAEVAVSNLQEVTVTTADGLRLLAWYVPPAEGRPVIVYFHGNGGHIGYRHRRLERFVGAGYGALFPEYRGYGGNPGSPTEAGMFIDARAALDFLAAQGIAPSRIVLYGESLGTGVAVQIASERASGALVLETPFSSVADVAQRRYPIFPVRLLLKDPFDAKSRIGLVRAPILMMLAGRDTIVPIQFGRALYDAAPEPKEMWINPEAGHVDLYELGGLDAALDFIRRRVPGAG